MKIVVLGGSGFLGSHLCDLFQIIYTNINANGDKVAEISPTFGEEARTQFFNHTLLFAILAHRTFQVPVDLSKVYDELVNYVADENAWSIIGMHCLILQKI